MIHTVVGVDIAKQVFQLYWVEETGEIMSVQLKRSRFLTHFANRAHCLIGMEACGGLPHWARAARVHWVPYSADQLLERGRAVGTSRQRQERPSVHDFHHESANSKSDGRQ